MPIRREPNYLYMTIGLLAAVILATSAGTQVSLAIAGVLAAAITFLMTDRGGDRHHVRRHDDRAFRLDPDQWKIRAFLSCLYSRFIP